MKYSLIVATINRTTELQKLLATLSYQTFTDFEVIVVDQNLDNRLNSIIQLFQDRLHLIHIVINPEGASKARNTGFEKSTGEYVTFPDDDCWYAPNTLDFVDNYFNQHDVDGITGIVLDENNEPLAGRYDKSGGLLDLKNLWIRGFLVTIFMKRKCFISTGGFDKMLGVGAKSKWGAGEETDLLIKCVKQKYNFYYTPDLIIYHPKTIGSSQLGKYDPKIYKRVFSYGMGMGFVLRKYKYPLSFVFYFMFRPFAGAALFLLKGNIHQSKFYFNSFYGRLKGWMEK